MSDKTEITHISADEIEATIDEIEKHEQLYSIALFDILGFSNFVETHDNKKIEELYDKLIHIIKRQESHPEGNSSQIPEVVPVPTSNDWKHNQLVDFAGGYVRVCYFSDTFLLYVNYDLKKPGMWLRDYFYEPYPLLKGEKNTEFHPAFYEFHYVYTSFLRTCMEFFCESVIEGVPLRGCISSGRAYMNKKESKYFGKALVEAARGESAQKSLGIAFGKSFNNYHPVYHHLYIPCGYHFKEDKEKTKYISQMILDWPRFWRETDLFKDKDFISYINNMDRDERFSNYYKTALKIFDFSKKHENWADELDWEDMSDIKSFYQRVNIWFESVEKRIC